MFIELESGSHFNGTLHSEITELESLLKHLLDNVFYVWIILLTFLTFNYAHLVTYLFLFCYEKDFMRFLARETDINDAINSTSRYHSLLTNCSKDISC